MRWEVVSGKLRGIDLHLDFAMNVVSMFRRKSVAPDLALYSKACSWLVDWVFDLCLDGGVGTIAEVQELAA